MNLIRTPGRGLGFRLHIEEPEFDAIALEALEASGQLPARPGPVRIDRFVEKRFELTIDYQDLGEGVLGATVFRPDGAVTAMVVSDSLTEERMRNLFRSTVAHEAGHGLLHSALFMQDAGQQVIRFDNTDQEGRRILCRNSDIEIRRPIGGRWWEYQANRMIGSLLLPRPLALQVVGEFTREAAITGSPLLPDEDRSRAVAALAETFHVSALAGHIRLGELHPRNSGQQHF